MPDGNPVAPPELAGDAPVADVREPIEEDFFLIFRNDRNDAFADDLDSLLGERLHFAEPLNGEARLDDGLAAVADGSGEAVVRDAVEEALRFEVFDDFFARGEAVEAGVRAGGFGHARVGINDFDFGELVALAHGEIVGVVSGRDFDGAGAEFAVHDFVGDDGDFAIYQRQNRFFADERFVAVIFRMDGDGRVAKHGFGTRGGDDDEF